MTASPASRLPITVPVTTTNHYAYDSVGNRLTETTSKGETAYTYDTANRLTSVNGQVSILPLRKMNEIPDS
jgi:YD repeat-containing protein